MLGLNLSTGSSLSTGGPCRAASVQFDTPHQRVADDTAQSATQYPVLADGALVIGPVGNATRRNASSHAQVTLVWPPRDPGGYTLIVDGVAKVADDALTVEPTGAVLHRPATHPGPSGSA